MYRVRSCVCSKSAIGRAAKRIKGGGNPKGNIYLLFSYIPLPHPHAVEPEGTLGGRAAGISALRTLEAWESKQESAVACLRAKMEGKEFRQLPKEKSPLYVHRTKRFL